MWSLGRWRRAGVVWAMGTSISVAAPAEAPAPAPANEDAMATARRDYEAIKAAGAGPEQQKLALPRQELPQLDLKPAGEPTPLPAMTARKEEAERLKKERAGRSRTWLLDAMKEPAGQSSMGARAGESQRIPEETQSGTNAGDFLSQAVDLAQESERSRREDKAADASQKLKAEVVNPLSAFMASWMTPRDLELLKPVSANATENGAMGSLTSPGAGDLKATMTTTAPQAFSLHDLTPPESGPAATDGGRRSNPYLGDFGAYVPPVALPQANVLPPAEPALHGPEAPAVPEPAPTVAPTSPGADWSKAKDDEKYFKQLKRF